jgi:hypothetical protein
MTARLPGRLTCHPLCELSLRRNILKVLDGDSEEPALAEKAVAFRNPLPARHLHCARRRRTLKACPQLLARPPRSLFPVCP